MRPCSPRAARGPLAALLSAILAAALPPGPPRARAQDPAPAGKAGPADGGKGEGGREEPVDAGLDPERTILREARSDPRNLKPDAFPVIRRPAYLPALEAPKMDPGEWVLGVVVGKTALAFPVNVLNHHEILVDEVEGVPILACWCPLCRTGAVHLRTLDGEVLDFGHSGLLYRSAYLLYDLGTRSLWLHSSGRALTGKMRGRRLETLPTRFVKWEVWRNSRPDTLVLAKNADDPEVTRDVFRNRNLGLKLTFGLGVIAGDEERLYELSELDRAGVVQESVGGVPVAVLWHPATETAVAWKRTLDGRVLDLRRGLDTGKGIPTLEESGQDRSVFDGVSGRCLSGPLRGKDLDPVISSFWEVYAWVAHHPRGTMFRASVPAPVDLPGIPDDE